MLRNNRLFEIYGIIQVLLFAILPLLSIGLIIDWWVTWLTNLSDPHAVIKMLLESSQGMLLRQREVGFTLVMLPLMSGLATLLNSNIRNGFLAVVALLCGWYFPFEIQRSLLNGTVANGPYKCHSWLWLRWHRTNFPHRI